MLESLSVYECAANTCFHIGPTVLDITQRIHCVSRRQVPRVTFNVPIMIEKKIMKTLLHFYDDILLMLFHIGKTSTTSYVADLSKGRKVSFELIKQYT